MSIQHNIQNTLDDDHPLLDELPEECYFNAWSKTVLEKVNSNIKTIFFN